MKLPREFYSRKTKEVARGILGKILVHRIEEGVLKGKIVEVEAYLGLDDPGAIGFRRVKNIPGALLMPAGYTFVYFRWKPLDAKRECKNGKTGSRVDKGFRTPGRNRNHEKEQRG